MSARVTVAIVSWNTRELLGRCLDALEPDHAGGLAEVWVVDNASTDGSAELVAESYPWVSLIASERNLGFGAAVNLVAARTETPWLAPANADVEVSPGALATLLRAGEADRRIGAVAPRLVLADGSAQHSVYSFPTLGFTALFNSGLARLIPGLADRLCLEGHWDATRGRAVDWAIAAFLLVRRGAWDAAGGFDPGQWMYAEDLDLGWRLARAGYETRYEPGAAVAHRSAASTEQAWGAERTSIWLTSTYSWMARRRGLALTRAAALLNLAGAAWRWAAFSLAAVVRPDPWAWRRDEMRRWLGLHRIGLARRRELLGSREPPGGRPQAGVGCADGSRRT